jgi:thiamine biosynthesis lipoprotein
MAAQQLEKLTRSMNRRGFLRISAACGLAAGLSLPLVRQLVAAGELAALHETRLLLGTLIHLNLIAPSSEQGQQASQAAFGEIQRLAGILDHRRADAALARLNAAGWLADAPAELVQVLGRAVHFGALSQGAFDVSVKPVLDARASGLPVGPALLERVDYRQIQIDGSRVSLGKPGMALTLDGIAKGWIIDATAGVLGRHGYENTLVEVGGDLMAGGLNGVGQPWRVGITHPRSTDPSQTIAVLQVTRAGLATSGDYRNSLSPDFFENHILDPRTGESPRELASATVIAPCCADADALSTTLMVLGAERGLALIAAIPGCAAMTVGKDLRIEQTKNFPRV